MSDDNPDNITFADFPPEAFPAIFEFITEAGVVVHKIVAVEPGVVRVPALRDKHGPISVRVTFASGDVVEAGPDGD